MTWHRNYSGKSDFTLDKPQSDGVGASPPPDVARQVAAARILADKLAIDVGPETASGPKVVISISGDGLPDGNVTASVTHPVGSVKGEPGRSQSNIGTVSTKEADIAAQQALVRGVVPLPRTLATSPDGINLGTVTQPVAPAKPTTKAEKAAAAKVAKGEKAAVAKSATAAKAKAAADKKAAVKAAAVAKKAKASR